MLNKLTWRKKTFLILVKKEFNLKGLYINYIMLVLDCLFQEIISFGFVVFEETIAPR